MRDELKIVAAAIVAIVLFTAALLYFMEFRAITGARRQPLAVEISETETDSPFTATERHDEIRGWIDSRLYQE